MTMRIGLLGLILLSVARTVAFSSASTAPAASSHETRPLQAQTIVVTGATGKVGSRLIQQLLLEKENDAKVKIVALVRNATKAQHMFRHYNSTGSDDDIGDNVNNNNDHCLLEIRQANFENQTEIELALQTMESTSADGNYSLFLACGNVPNQAELELNVVRAATSTASPSSFCTFCVKLSTAQPLVEQSIGTGAIHEQIESELSSLFSSSSPSPLSQQPPRWCILRPNLFAQMLDPTLGGPLMGIHLQDTTEEGDDKKTISSSSCRHILANNKISIVDCNDVAACAKAILLLQSSSSLLSSQNNIDTQLTEQRAKHGGKVYELTGPEPIQISKHVAEYISQFRIEDNISIKPCTLEELGMPEQISPFITALGKYEQVTNHIEEITGRPPTSIRETLFQNPRPFLPRTFRRLLATGKADSFRQAAKVTRTDEDFFRSFIDTMEDDELLIRVCSAGVNGGADTFGVTRASEDAKDFPLGNEGTGIVVLCGKKVNKFHPSETAVFVGGGAYGEYAKVKEARCAKVPAECTATPSELTALRISALTALVALTRTCPVQSNDVVLVSACCGGTGHFAAQIAKNNGATVIGTVGSTAKVSIAKSLGCIDRIVDLSKEDLGKVLQTEFPQGINVCYEGVGGKVLRDVYDNLADNGKVLVVGSISQYPHNKEKDSDGVIAELGGTDIMEIFRSGKTIELSRGRTLIGNVWGDLFRSGEMNVYRNRVFELHTQGKLRVLLDKTNEFHGVDSVCDAVDHMLSRKSIGKVCVTISN